MHRKVLLSISIVTLIIFSLVMTVVLIYKAKNNDKLENNNIKNISLVYRYTNHAWGDFDYAYLIDMEGTVLHFNYIKQPGDRPSIDKDSIDFRDDLLKNTESENYVDQYKTNIALREIKESLYSINYNTITLKYKNNAIDAGSECFYCLI